MKKLLLFITTILIFIVPIKVNAADTQEGMSFTYNIEVPDNQKNKELSYFDLTMTPNQEQTVQMTLTNLSDKEQVVETLIDSAKTNSNGVIEYNQTGIKLDKSAIVDFRDIVKTDKEVVLKPKESKKIDIKIKMPKIEFDGTLAGGITLKQKDQETGTTASNGSKVKNQFAYVVAILLQENDKVIEPDLEYRKTYAGDRNYNNTIFTQIANVKPTYVGDMTLETQITKKGENKVLYEERKTGIQMAPTSAIDFPISMYNEEMVPGKYMIKINAKIKDKSWDWNEEFEITKEQAEKYNEKNSSLTQERFDWKLVGLVVGIFIVVFLILYFIFSVIRKKKGNSKGKSKKSKKTGRR